MRGARARMRSVVTGLVAVLAGSVLLSGCDFDVYELPLPGGTDVGADPIEVTVQFRDVLDLVPQSDVKVNEVSVGRVTSIELDEKDRHAEVTLLLRNDTGLPDNPLASIRQTSLLGEKFVSLEAPPTGATGALGDQDDIPLERSGRNPEVEEVLGALSLVLNGGGVAQLKTITQEVNAALGGREDSARSVLNQVDSLVSQLDERKTDIVAAIESVNRLAVSAREQQDSIDLALEELPSALDSLDSQREDLVAMLDGLSRLSKVGTRVIRTVKADTVDALERLAPVLTQIDAAGDSFVNAFSTFLTFPFVDESVGRDPQVARNLHMGDYVNLSADLDLDLANLGLPELICIPFNELPDLPIDDLLDLKGLCNGVEDALQKCVKTPVDLSECSKLPGRVLDTICESLNLRPVCNLVDGLTGGALNGGRGNGGGSGSGGGGGGGLLGDLLGNLGLGALGRTAPDYTAPEYSEADEKDARNWERFDETYDADLLRLIGAPLTESPGGAR